MNILVYDVAAEYGGATSVLDYYYARHKKDVENHYYYVLSTYKVDETPNITVINVPEIKKGWGHRLWFDLIGVKKLLKEYQIDEVLSLQNIMIPFWKGKQTVYLHNAIPFNDYRFSFSKDRTLWIYQNIIGLLMKYSVRKADHVIVQTSLMKKSVVSYAPKTEQKISIEFPELDIPEGCVYQSGEENLFFYPANASSFKNHRVIVEACEKLFNRGITNFSVVFTIKGEESPNVRELKEKSERWDNISWLGTIPRSEVFEWYKKSVLVFPSYIETVGLPIYEAMHVGCPMILADCDYSHNVAGDYAEAVYFNFDDSCQLADRMAEKILGSGERG